MMVESSINDLSLEYRMINGGRCWTWGMVTAMTAKGWQLVEDLVTRMLVTADGRIPVSSRGGLYKEMTVECAK